MTALGHAVPDLETFRALVESKVTAADAPLASAIEQNVPIYDGDMVRRAVESPSAIDALRAEIAHQLLDGPGIVAFSNAFDNHDVVDRATDVFRAIIAEQHAAGMATGDHYAKPGANDRVWNALEKLALAAPEVFVDYYSNDIVATACEAWLGPNYQITSQVNQVNPGGTAQVPHCDYHIGFLSHDQAVQYPLHAHQLSATLTLQGAISHVDMPVETGPTVYLPFSQRYDLGYLSWARPEFRDYFWHHHVQLELRKGDAVFFNPSLFHAAGSNRTTDVYRLANLLQVNSAFGRALENVDRERVVNAVYRPLAARHAAGTDVKNALAAAAEGYAFPTNLDRDPPIGGMAPASQADIVRLALAERWTGAELAIAMTALRVRQATH
jgi:ectoine hydroxylase-related dioxygenase (phytanoyl-CoA dioxygenase family)